MSNGTVHLQIQSGGANLLFGQNFSQKLHENDRILTPWDTSLDHPVCNPPMEHETTQITVSDPGFSRGGGANPKGGGANLLFGQLHENEEILGQGRGRVFLALPLDLPLDYNPKILLQLVKKG